MARKKINPLGAIRLTGIETRRPPNYAAGIAGIQKAVEHTTEQMGVTRAFKALNKLNQKHGIDCPGCAWPDPDDKRSVLGEYCENGAKALAEEATLSKIGADFFKEYSIQELSDWTDYQLGKAGRLTQPMILKPNSNHYEPIEWNKAFELIADEVNTLNDPNQAIFYTSGRSSNEAAFLYALLARTIGTNNLPDCSNMCHESSGVGLKQTLGIGKGSVTLNDFEKAEVILVIGQNPGTNHPRMLSALADCKKNGGKIISINPLYEAGLKRFVNPQKPLDYVTGGTQLADLHLPIKINQDVALLKAISKELIHLDNGSNGVLDHDFIQEKTSCFDEFQNDLENYDTSDLLQQAGITFKDFAKAVKIISRSEKIIICWAMGLTQHKNAVDNIKEVVNLLLLKGSVGKEGAGTCPVRGHSNVQGDRTVGIMTKPSPILNEKLKQTFDIDPPVKEGLDTVGCIKAMHDGKAKVFVSLGGNFVSAASDTLYTSSALQNCSLTVSISTKLNRTHTCAGKTSIILPTLGRSELDLKNGKKQFVTVENSMGKVHSSAGVLPPASKQLKSEPEIICGLSAAILGENIPINWSDYAEDYNLIREKIEVVVSGFESYNQRTIESKNGFYLPNNARDADFSKLPNGRAQFSICPLPAHVLEKEEFLLMTIRSHDQFNTTIYGLDDRYRGVRNERRVLLMNEQDMSDMGLGHLDFVDIISNYNGVQRKAELFHVIKYEIPRGNLAAYFPETNVLVPIDEYADHSRTPISKSIKVSLTKR
jgi:molybdopterin-dependent oxidoreductase alpha subunit